MNQSRIFYGFSVAEKWGNVAIQLYHSSWMRHSTPYLLHIREKWINNEFLTVHTDRQLTNMGFLKDEELEYVFPINISNQDDIAGSFLPLITSKLDELNQSFLNNGNHDD
jgi:hypothetical protein